MVGGLVPVLLYSLQMPVCTVFKTKHSDSLLVTSYHVRDPIILILLVNSHCVVRNIPTLERNVSSMLEYDTCGETVMTGT